MTTHVSRDFSARMLARPGCILYQRNANEYEAKYAEMMRDCFGLHFLFPSPGTVERGDKVIYLDTNARWSTILVD